MSEHNTPATARHERIAGEILVLMRWDKTPSVRDMLRLEQRIAAALAAESKLADTERALFSEAKDLLRKVVRTCDDHIARDPGAMGDAVVASAIECYLRRAGSDYAAPGGGEDGE